MTEQREIKFRAWDCLDKKMQYDITKTKEYSNVDGGYDIVGFDNYLNDSVGSVVMQYTGLKDKNGKEIYEGDLISEEIIDENGNSEWTKDNYTLIGWRNYGFGYISNPFSKEEFFERFYSEEVENGKMSCEVIGNIYENPELLEAK
ncbi:MAG: hypothetical protein EBS06_05550 [Proteobacteria bacterium]|nr:hypothetical protein [Pseudomonadota bacterium]